MPTDPEILAATTEEERRQYNFYWKRKGDKRYLCKKPKPPPSKLKPLRTQKKHIGEQVKSLPLDKPTLELVDKLLERLQNKDPEILEELHSLLV